MTKSSDYKNLFGQVSNKNDRQTFVVGVEYTLPWLVVADARIDGDGKLRFQLSREEVPITKRLRFNLMGNTDKEYAVGFRYIVSKWFALSTHYDSDMGYGAGVTITSVSYTHLRAHETPEHLVCRLLLEKKNH